MAGIILMFPDTVGESRSHSDPRSNAPAGAQSANAIGLGRLFWMAVGAVMAIKAGLLAADHMPNFFMGDSAAFIGTALTKWFPPQRSWTYGFLIRLICLPAQSLLPLLVAQTLGGMVTCVALGVCLRRYMGVAPAIAGAAIILCALDPLQLLYERMVMTEALSLTVLALMWWGVFAYCRRPRLGTLLMLQLLYAALFSLRLQFLLPGGVLMLILPLAGFAPARQPYLAAWRARERLGKILTHTLASLLLMMALHGAYRVAMGIKNRQPPAYSYGTSAMVLSAFAPLLHPEDAPSPALAAAIRNDAACPLADRSLRNDQLWNAGGLIDRLNQVDQLDQADGGEYRADLDEKRIVRHMVLRDPLGLLPAALQSYAGYWDIAAMPGTLQPERASGPYDAAFTESLARHFRLDASRYPRESLTKRLHAWLPPWLILLLACPLLLVAALFRAGPRLRRETGLLLLVSTIMLAQNTMLSTMTVYRYLQPLTFATLLALAIIWNGRPAPDAPGLADPPA